MIGGVAWAQHRGGIDKVEVRIDGGGWQQARLGPSRRPATTGASGTSPGTPSPGQHSLAVRATTGDGEVQTAARATPFPDGSSGIQEIVVSVT